MQSPKDKQTRAKMSRRRKLLLIFLGMVAVLACWVAWRWYEIDRRFEDTRAELKERGYPTSLEELDEFYESPPVEENAALVYLAAFDAFVGVDSGVDPPIWDGEWYVDPWTPIPQDALDSMAPFIASNAEPYKMLIDGAALDRSRYPVDLSNVESSIDHFGELRHLARQLQAYAMYHAELGHTEEAVNAIDALFSVGESLRDEPRTIAQLVRFAILPMGIVATEDVLARSEWTGESLADLAGVVDRVDIAGATRIGLNEDIVEVFSIDAYANPYWLSELLTSQMGYSELFGEVLRNTWASFTSAKEERRIFALDIASLAEATVGPFPNAIASVKEAQSTIEDRPGGETQYTTTIRRTATMIVVEARTAAQLRLLEAIVAIERHRIATQNLPETLEVISPEFMESVPLDPFDGQPIRYLPREKGYTLYSIGENGTDENGVKGESMREGDIVIEVRH